MDLLWTLFIFWLSGVGLLTWNGRFEAPKIISFFIVCFIFCIYILIRKRNILVKLFKLGDLLYFIWLFILSYSSYKGVHVLDSILGGSYRHQGIIFFFGLWVISKVIILLPERYKKLLKLSFLPVFYLEFFIIIFQSVLGKLGLLGTFGEINASTGFLVFLLPFIISINKYLFSKKSAFFDYLCIFIVFVAIFISSSRSAFIAVLPVLYFVFKRDHFLIFKFKKTSFNIYLVAFLSILGFSYIVFRNGHVGKKILPFESRETIWKFGIEKVKERPVWGFGAESSEVVYEDAFRKNNLFLVDLIIDRSHNLFMDVTLWSGLAGLVFFVSWLIAEGHFLYRRKLWVNFVGLLSFLIYSFFQPLSVVHWLFLLLFFNLF